MGNVIEVNSSNFDQEVLRAKGLVLVDFAAEWCGPCKRLSPIIHELASHYDGKANIPHLDVDNAPDIAAQFGVMSVPTVLLFKNGKKVSESIGLVPKERLEETIKANL